MKQDDINYSKMLKNYYSIDDIDFSKKEIVAKYVLFYETDEEKEILEKNNIYMLSDECTKAEIHDFFENKIYEKELVALHKSDMGLVVIFNDLKIPAIIVAVDITAERFFDKQSISFDVSSDFVSEAQMGKLKQILIGKVTYYKNVCLMPNALWVHITDKDETLSIEIFNTCKETKYNMENILDEDMMSIQNALMKNAGHTS
ncbi:MAG: hypothetical protein HUJ68_10030 [Clostridia bacterium]|nr:hypothetical protein [Clostridia bacterium]